LQKHPQAIKKRERRFKTSEQTGINWTINKTEYFILPYYL
jgi:hypothetical protein